MASTLLTIRNLVHAAIDAKKAINGFVFNNFTTGAAWLPYGKVEDLPAAGKVWVVGITTDQTPLLSRTNMVAQEIMVQVAFQRVVNAQDEATLDACVELYEQLMAVARKSVDPTETFTWLRNECLKDENGTPFSFVGLRQSSIFEAYFTAVYKTHLE